MYFLMQSAFWYFETMAVSECCLIKSFPYILFEKYIYILALEMASPGNQHCANCIGTLSFPTKESSIFRIYMVENRTVSRIPTPHAATDACQRA